MKVKTSSGVSKGIDITEGVLQGETLIPLLFSILIADMEEFLLARGIRGVRINQLTSIILLAFVDDIDFVAETEEELLNMLNALHEYCLLNELTVYTSETKVGII